MKYPELITPVAGTVYINRNRQQYKCLFTIDQEYAVMQRITDRWTFTACRTRKFEDGTIEWDQSIGCFWPEGRPSHG